MNLYLLILLVALLLAALIIWGVQSLNPKGFNAAAKKGVDGAKATVVEKVDEAKAAVEQRLK